MTEAAYDATARERVAAWRAEVLKPAGPMGRAARTLQKRINQVIPEKIHQAVTAAIETMTRGMLTGADITTPKPVKGLSLRRRDHLANEKIKQWCATAAAEGGITGAGGFLMAAADF